MTLVLLFYAFGAAVTGAWSAGVQGIGGDRYDRAALAALILLWPISWLIAAGMAIANLQARFER